MISLRSTVFLALAVTALVTGRPADAGPSPAEAGGVPRVTRVFHLRGMTSREATTLLRAQVRIVQLATVPDRDVVVVRDVADKVDRAEHLLRESDAIARVADPHLPLDLERLAREPTATRVFRIDDENVEPAVTVLRSIYQVGNVEELPGGDGLTVRAPQAVLDAAEALLRELGLLGESDAVHGAR